MLNASARLLRLQRARAWMLAMLFAFGCDRAPSAEGAREWTAADHDHADEKGKVLSGASTDGRGPATRGAKVAGNGGGSETAKLVELTWQKQCAMCHGTEGRGDGPSGPMVKAPDLTRADWQDKVSDQEIAAVIAAGKGQMPKFELTPEVLDGLVGRIRASKGR